MDNSTITLISLVAIVIALCQMTPVKSKENFLGNLPSMQTKVFRNIENKGNFFSVPGQYQAMLSPRMSGGVDYGANIRYNVPAYTNLAVPSDPLSMGNMATKENFSRKSTNEVPSNLRHKVGTPAGFAAGNYNEVSTKGYESKNAYLNSQSTLPVGTMSSINQLGEVEQPIIYDQLSYANRRSKLRSGGDPIRGDLPIIPMSGGWFVPSVDPQIDLQSGAMNVMGGMMNETTSQLAQLIANASQGTASSVGGVNMSNIYGTVLENGRGDVQITAYP